MSTFAEIPYIRLTDTQKPVALAMLRRTAILLKKWSVYFSPKKFRQFRNAVMAGDKNPQKQILCSHCNGKESKKLDCTNCCGNGFIKVDAIPAELLAEFHTDLPEILSIRQPMVEFEGRSVEQAVLESFSAMAKRHVRQWAQQDGNSCGVTRKDYLQEAYMTIIEAMYQYNREDVDLPTFVWHTLRNRMINVTNQSSLLRRLTNSDLSLVCRYEKAKKQNGGTFDEIVESLGLSAEEGRYLGTILTKVISENQMSLDETSSGERDRTGNDYTGHRSGIDSEVLEITNVDQDEHVNQILSSAGLTDFERKVLEAAMKNTDEGRGSKRRSEGWQAEFARTHFHPDGRPFTRVWIGMVWKKARAKVAAVLEQESEAA